MKKELAGRALPVIARMDRDSTAKRGSHQEIYKDWVSSKIQILVGTQMVSKGWDVSRVGLVGIISADTILHLPDFRSSERTFQILTQVAGRAGRGTDVGVVILQTYNPDNYAIQAAKLHDYEGFYTHEIALRQKYVYPPFSRLVKLTFSHKLKEKAMDLAGSAVRKITTHSIPSLEVIGPVPAFILKLRGKYRYQIVLRTARDTPLELYKLLSDFASGADIDVDPESLL